MENMTFIKNKEEKKESDNEVVLRFMKTQDVQSFNEILKRHKDFVNNRIGRYIKTAQDIEDISQEVFIKVFKEIKKGTYKEEGNFKSWIGTITNHQCIDFLRRKKKRPAGLSFEDDPSTTNMFKNLMSPELNPLESMQYEDFLNNLEDIIEKLPPDQAEAIRIYLFEGKTYKDIAVLMGTSVSTTSARIRSAYIAISKSLSVLYPNINFDFLFKNTEKDGQESKEKKTPREHYKRKKDEDEDK